MKSQKFLVNELSEYFDIQKILRLQFLSTYLKNLINRNAWSIKNNRKTTSNISEIIWLLPVRGIQTVTSLLYQLPHTESTFWTLSYRLIVAHRKIIFCKNNLRSRVFATLTEENGFFLRLTETYNLTEFELSRCHCSKLHQKKLQLLSRYFLLELF